ncbi:hypothetical protein ACFSTC_13180 [Nonomuraea ferruginea]
MAGPAGRPHDRVGDHDRLITVRPRGYHEGHQLMWTGMPSE